MKSEEKGNGERKNNVKINPPPVLPILNSNEIVVQNNNKYTGSAIDPKIWGPGLWEMLERYAFEYSPNPTAQEKEFAKQVYTQFVYHFMYCPECAHHWFAMMIRAPPDVTSADTLSRWLCDRHNEVSKRLGKATWPYERTLQRYRQKKAHSRDLAHGLTTVEDLDQHLPMLTILGAVLLPWMMRSLFRPRFY